MGPMLKRFIAIASLCFLGAASFSDADDALPLSAVTTNDVVITNTVTTNLVTTNSVTINSVATNAFCFPVGERLTYGLYWGVIPVGEAVMESTWIEENGRRLLCLVSTAKSGRVLSGIYPLDDYVKSVVDPVTFLPVRYEQRLHEGRHVRHDIVTFDREKLVAHWRSELNGRTNDIPILKDTRDVVCLSYYMRMQTYTGQEKLSFQVLVDDKLYALNVSFEGKEKLKVDGHGSVPCFKLEPVAKFGAIFVRKGKVNLWFSEDNRHICTRMSGKVPVASVKAILTAVTGDADAPWKPDAK